MIRIVTDQGISGYSQAESAKPYLKPMVAYYNQSLFQNAPRQDECDPTRAQAPQIGSWCGRIRARSAANRLTLM